MKGFSVGHLWAGPLLKQVAHLAEACGILYGVSDMPKHDRPAPTPAPPNPASSQRIDLHVHFDSEPGVTQKLDVILTHLQALRRQGDSIVATLQELKDELTAIKTAVDAAKATAEAQIAEIKRLSDLLAAGTLVTQADLDALDAQADEILAALAPTP